MGTKSNNTNNVTDDDNISNGDESNKGNDTSLIVNVNDTQSDIDEQEEASNYSETDVVEQVEEEDEETEKTEKKEKETPTKKSTQRNGDSSKKRFVKTLLC